MIDETGCQACDFPKHSRRQVATDGYRNCAKIPPCVSYTQKTLIWQALIHTLE